MLKTLAAVLVAFPLVASAAEAKQPVPPPGIPIEFFTVVNYNNAVVTNDTTVGGSSGIGFRLLGSGQDRFLGSDIQTAVIIQDQTTDIRFATEDPARIFVAPDGRTSDHVFLPFGSVTWFIRFRQGPFLNENWYMLPINWQLP